MTAVSISTLGCKVNQFESEALKASLEQRGYGIVPFGSRADVTIINTCTVTHRADFQSRQMVRRATRSNPGSLIIVTGCYAQAEPDAFEAMEGIGYLLGNAEKNRIPDLLPRLEKGGLPRVQVTDIGREAFFSDLPLHSFHDHTRAFLKIQDGCDACCSYCIVPSARGRSRSLPVEKVLGHLRRLKEKGYKEVVLTGIHMGSYGSDLIPSVRLEELLKRLEHEETPDRIRLSSIEPLDFSADLISVLSTSTKVCPHLHIPVQSGDDEILRRMNRNYDHSYLSDVLRELCQRIPEVSIGTDVIAGFPGETEENFARTFRLIESLPFSYLHVFPFSRRKGTPALRFPRQVGEPEIKKRALALREMGKEKRRAFYRRFVDRDLSVLVEDRRDRETGRWKGLSRNYIPVLLAQTNRSEAGRDWVNHEWSVRVTGSTETGVTGRVCEKQGMGG